MKFVSAADSAQSGHLNENTLERVMNGATTGAVAGAIAGLGFAVVVSGGFWSN